MNCVYCMDKGYVVMSDGQQLPCYRCKQSAPLTEEQASDIDTLVNCLPAHKCGLYIDHNAYKDCYETIEDAVAEQEDWVSDAEKQRALETGEMWTIQWYPNTPVGFNTIAASTLTAALAGCI